MNRTIRLIIAIILTTMMIFTLTGCGKEDDAQKIPQVIHVMDEEGDNTIPIELTLVNVCGVDVGMFSMIDPATKEQINVASIANNESISVGANWPKDEVKFSWALYNKDGELCIEATSDITGITKSATVIISGDGDVEKVDVNVE